MLGIFVTWSKASFETATGVLYIAIADRVIAPAGARAVNSWGHGNVYSQTSLLDGVLRTTEALKYFW